MKNVLVPQDSGFTLIELLILMSLIALMLAIPVPDLLDARKSGNESSAIGTLRAVNNAQGLYQQRDSDKNGTADYSTNGEGLTDAGLLNAEIPTAEEKGYKIEFKVPEDRLSYEVIARPKKAFRDGDHMFRTTNTVELQCAQASSKKKAPVNWSDDIETCQATTSKASKRAKKREIAKLKKNLKKLYCSLTPSSLQGRSRATYAQIRKTTSVHPIILGALDQNQDGVLSIAEFEAVATDPESIVAAIVAQLSFGHNSEINGKKNIRSKLFNFLQSKVFSGFSDETKASLADQNISEINLKKALSQLNKSLKCQQ